MTFVRFHKVVARQRRNLAQDALTAVALTGALALSSAALQAVMH